MKKTLRWYLAWGIMVASLSMLLFMVTAGPAHAWTQEKNDWDTGGDAQCSGSHQTNDGHPERHTYPNQAIPCVYWQEPHNFSINLFFLMDSSLNSSLSGFYDFTAAVNGAFAQYVQIPAWNPYMYQCTTNCPPTAYAGYYMMSFLSCTEYAETNYQTTIPQWGWNPQRGENEWYAFFVRGSIQVLFNDREIWNNNQDWTGNCALGTEHADGRTVAAHETGHVVGLGHTSADPSIMNITNAKFAQIYQLTDNEIHGVEAIYPGDQQSG